eukprot:scaffold106020_cov28-Tisochrysis_lutea.AAC.1
MWPAWRQALRAAGRWRGGAQLGRGREMRGAVCARMRGSRPLRPQPCQSLASREQCRGDDCSAAAAPRTVVEGVGGVQRARRRGSRLPSPAGRVRTRLYPREGTPGGAPRQPRAARRPFPRRGADPHTRENSGMY